jgi:hypothetical protein
MQNPAPEGLGCDTDGEGGGLGVAVDVRRCDGKLVGSGDDDFAGVTGIRAAGNGLQRNQQKCDGEEARDLAASREAKWHECEQY